MKRFLIILVISITSLSSLFSKNINADSLINIIPTLEGTKKIDALNKVSSVLWLQDKNKSLRYAKTALELSNEIDYKKGIAGALSSMGVIALYDNDEKNAVLYLNKALKIYEEINDSTSVTKTHINLGAIYYNSGFLDESIEHSFIAIDRLNKGIFDLNIEMAKSTLYNNLALCYIDKEEFLKALEYINKTIELKIANKDELGLASAYGNLGLVYKSLDSLDLAVDYYNKSILYLKKFDNQYGLVISYSNIGGVYSKKNEYDSAEYYLNKSIVISKELKVYKNVVSSNNELSQLYEKKGEYKQALVYFKESLAYKDSINNSELYTEIGKIEDKYKQQKIDRDIKIQNIEKQKEKIIKHSLIAFIVIILILIVLLYSRYKIKTRSAQKLQVLNNEKDKFFSIISHDLRGPFNAFLTLSDIMANSYRDLKSDEVFDYAQKINKSAIRINNLLENLLEWSISQTGTRQYTPDRINLNKLADKSIKLLFMNAVKKNIEIENNINLSHNVYADLNSTKTILRNLINNSIKFSNSDGKIEVNSKDIGEFIEITVKDYGVGISQENINKIFRIDIQFSTKGTANEKGTGLGLLLCKEFVEKNGGTIRIDSILNVGTSFIFTLKKI